MVEKKTTKKSSVKKPKTEGKTAKTKNSKNKTKSTKSKSKTKNEPYGDAGIVIVDDDIEIDKDKVNEERRAYLEEARSQEASD